jgi:hypothetical protein
MRNMWGKMGFSLPGMVTPTLDVDELDKRIADMKAVENWLKMNLNSLQMATQALEMQRATIATMQAMSKIASEGGAGRRPGRPAQPLRQRHVAVEPDAAGRRSQGRPGAHPQRPGRVGQGQAERQQVTATAGASPLAGAGLRRGRATRHALPVCSPPSM